MQSYVVVIRGEEIPVPQLTYEEVSQLVTDWRIGGVTDPIGQLISWLWEKIRDLMGSISSAIMGAINSAVSSIMSGIRSLIDSLSNSIAGLINTIKISIQGVASALSNVISSIISAISSGISGVISFLQEVGRSIMSTIGGIVSTIGGIVSSAISGLTSMISGILSAISTAIGGIVSTISNVFSGLMSAISSMISGIISTVSSILSGIGSMLSGLLSSIVSVISGIASTISSTISSVFSQLGSLLSNLRSVIISAIDTLVSKISSILTQMAGAISGIVSTISSALKGFVDVVISAISGVVSMIKESISGIVTSVQGVVSGIYSFFGSVFEQISNNLLLVGSYLTGFVNAIFDVGAKIWDVLSKMAVVMTDAAQAIIGGLTTALASLVDMLVKAIEPLWLPAQKFYEWAITGHSPSFVDFVDSVVKFFTEDVPKILTGDIPEFFSKLWEALVEGTKQVWEPIKNFFDWVYSNVSDFFTKTIPKFVDDVVKFFTGDVPAFFSSLWSALVEFTKPVWEPIKNFLDWVYNSLADFFTKTLPEFFTKTVPEFFTKTIPEFFENVVKFFTGDVPAFFSSLWSGLVEFTRPVWEPIKNFLDWVYNSLADFFTKTLPEFFTKTVPEFFTKTIPAFFNNVVKFFTGDVPAFFSGLWSGFVEFTKPVWEPISNAIATAGEVIGKAGEIVYQVFNDVILKFFTEDIPKFFTETLPQIGHDMWDWFVTGVQDLGDKIRRFFEFLASSLASAIVGIRGTVESIFSPILNQFASKATTAALEAVKVGSPPKEIDDFVKTIVKIQQDTIYELAKKLKKGSPGMVFTLATAFSLTGTFLALKASVEGIGLLFDLGHPNKNMQFRKYFKSLLDASGGFFLSSAPAAAFTFFILHQSLRRVLYKLFPVVLPGPEQLVRMWVRLSLAESDVDEALAELGYASELREGFKELGTSLLSPREIVEAVSRGYLDMQKAMFELRKHGYLSRDGVDRAGIVLELTRPYPSIDDLIKFWRLGKYTDEDLIKYIEWRGYRKEFIDAYYTSRLSIPSVSEMITAVVKEAMDPIAFKELLRRQGLIELDKYEKELNVSGIAAMGIATVEETLGKPKGPLTWADVLWEAHWRLPALERVIEFANRAMVGMAHVAGKLITLKTEDASKTVLLYSRLWDFKPVPRKHTVLVGGTATTISMPVSDAEIMEALRFRVLTRIESRFVRRWGLISEDDFKRLLVAQGVSPYITIKTIDGEEISMLDALMRAEFMQDLLEERTHFRTSIISAFQKGYNIAVDVFDPVKKTSVKVETLKLEEALMALRFRPEEASWLASSARLRRIVDLRDDAVKGLVDDYVSGAASLETFKDSLKGVIDDEEVRNSVIEYAVKRRMIARYRRMANRLDRTLISEASTMMKLYEQGFSTRSDVEQKLGELVSKELLLPEEKDVLLSIADTRRMRELRELGIRALAKKLSRGEITVEQFKASAQKLGIDKEFIDAMMENYALAHTLSVSQLVNYADEVPIPPDLLEKKLKTLRVPEDEKKIIMEVVKRRPLRDDVSSLIYWFTSLARSLDVMPGDMNILAELGMTEEEIKLRQKVVSMLNRKAVRDRIRAALEVMLREQYQGLAKGKDLGLITLQQFYNAMKALKYPDDFIIARAQEIVASAAQTVVPEFKSLQTQLLGGGVAM